MAYLVTPPLSPRKAPRFTSRGAAEEHARDKARDGYVSKVMRAGNRDVIYTCRPVGGQAISCKIVEGGFAGARTRRRKRRR